MISLIPRDGLLWILSHLTRLIIVHLEIGAICIIIAALTAMKVIPHDVAKYCAVVIGLAFFSTFGITSTSMYTVVSEYVGNDEYIDITPFDDTDDKFVKNENYVEKTDKAGNGDEVTD